MQQPSQPSAFDALDPRDREQVEASLLLAERIYRDADAAKTPHERALDAERSRMVKDLGGKQTLAALMDQAFRSRRNDVTARQFARILNTHGVPGFFGPFERAGLEAFRHLASTMPAVLVPIVKAVMQEKTKEVILPGEPEKLIAHVRERSKEGVRLNVNHLGEMILGEAEADAKTEDDVLLLQNPDIDCISTKASNLYSQITALAHSHSVRQMVERMRPRLRAAKANKRKDYDPAKAAPWDLGYKLVNLDMEEYRDLDITVEAFQVGLSEPEFMDLQVGLALQAYIPDSYGYTKELLAFAHDRVKKGGAPIRIRVVKGANMAVERVDSSVRDLAVPTYEVKADTDANWKTMVELISRPENIAVCHLGIASHNVFDMAWAAELVKSRDVEQYVLYEMLEGMANHVQRVVQREVGKVLLYAPSVPADKFLTAIAYLMRRFDELTDPDNFLSHIFGIEPGSPQWKSLAAAFADSVRRMKTVSHFRKRTQNRAAEAYDFVPFRTLSEFRNERDTDWTALENREWLERDVSFRLQKLRVGRPERILLGIARREEDPSRQIANVHDRSYPELLTAQVELATDADLDAALSAAVEGTGWSSLPFEQREAILTAAAAGIARRRADFMYYAATNTAKTFDQSDAEVSEAVDFGRFYPLSVRALRDELPQVDLRPLGNGVIVVVSPWNFPIAIPAGGVFAALAAGNRVILKPSPESMLVTGKLADAFWEAGVPREALQVVNCDNAGAAKLVADDRVDAVIFTGSTATADKIIASRPDLHLFAETGGKNCTIVTDKADRELAIKHIADSFRNNGQKCSATSIVIVTPDIYADRSFWSQLVDAVSSLPVGSAWDPESVITPLFRNPGPELQRGLTTLEEGESWELEPVRMQEGPDGRLDYWGPGIKKGTKRGSFTHRTELFGPVITVMIASTLDEALDIVHETGRGLTLGVETLDEQEFAYVAERAKVGVIYGRRATVGAIVHRQTFGGWADSRRGPGIHAGGLNYVTNFMSFVKAGEASTLPTADFANAWNDFFSKDHRPAQNVRGEDNVHRYRPLGNVVVRVAAGDDAQNIRLRALAAQAAGNKVTISFPTSAASVAAAARGMDELGAANGIVWHEEEDDALVGRLEKDGIALLRYGSRESVPAGMWQAVAAWPRTYLDARPPVAHPRIEMLRVVQEQTIADTYHRYGGSLREKDNA